MLPKAVAHMLAGSQSSASYVPNHLPLAYPLAALHGALAHVEVLCGINVVVFNFDVIAITATIGRCLNHAGCCGYNRGAVRCREIRTQMRFPPRSEEHTSELQSLMRISYAVFCLK